MYIKNEESVDSDQYPFINTVLIFTTLHPPPQTSHVSKTPKYIVPIVRQLFRNMRSISLVLLYAALLTKSVTMAFPHPVEQEALSNVTAIDDGHEGMFP